MSDSTNIIEKTTNPEEIAEDQKNGGNDEDSILIKNGGKDGNMADINDLERGEQGRVMRKDKEKNYGREEESRLISYEELKQYRKSPLWRALRFILFGGVAVIFAALITVAVLIVMMSSKCEELPNGVGLVMPKEEQIPKVYPRQLTVLTGQEAIFHCEFPTGQVEWRRLDPHGLFAEFPSGVEKTENGQLKIPVADTNHQGEFACQVMDESNTKNMNTPQVVRLYVLNSAIKENEGEKPAITSRNGREELPPLALKPRVDSYLMIASAGEPVHFRCWNCQFAECRTSHRLVWQKVNGSKNGENEILSTNGPLAIERDVQSVFMIFQEVRQTDAGIYECLDQGTGATSSQVHLQVEPPRTPVIIPMNQTVPGNTTALIQCTVPGRTDAKLSWRLENGVEAEELTGVRDDGRGLLRIEHVRAEHVRHGYVCWAMYPKRADKQALHAGPAKVYIIGGEQPQGWVIEEVHSTEEPLEEIKEEKKEERSTKEIILEVQTTPENKIVAGGQIENLDEEVENSTSKNAVEETEEERNRIEDKEEKNDEASGEKDGVIGELKEKDVEKMAENKEEKKKDEGNEEKKEVGDDEKKEDEKEESLRDNNEERVKVEADGEEKKEEKVKERKEEEEVKEEKKEEKVKEGKEEEDVKEEKNEDEVKKEEQEDEVKEEKKGEDVLKEKEKEDEVKEAKKEEDKEDDNEASEAMKEEIDEVIDNEKGKEIEDKAILKNETNVKADKDEIKEAEADKENEESKRVEEKKEEAKEKTKETEEAKKDDSAEEKKGVEEKQEVVEENKKEKNEGVEEKKEEDKKKVVEEKKEGVEDEKEKNGKKGKEGVEETKEEIEGEKKGVIEENTEKVEVKKENDKEEKKEQVVEEKKEVEEKNEGVDDKREEEKEGVQEKNEEITDDTLKETNEEKIEKVSTANKEEKELEEKEKGVSEEEEEGKGKEPNEETDRKPGEEEKKKDDEVSGEATIQIERLVHSISASGSKTNETTNNEGREEIEENGVEEKGETKTEEDENNTASSNNFWLVLDALMGIMPI